MKFSCITEGSAKYSYVSKKLDTEHAQLSVSAPLFFLQIVNIIDREEPRRMATDECAVLYECDGMNVFTIKYQNLPLDQPACTHGPADLLHSSVCLRIL